MEINNIGIIGAGQMGLGIAHVCAGSGNNVTLVDIDKEALERARTIICLLYTSPSPRDGLLSRMPSSA